MNETEVRYYKKMFLSGAVFNWCAALLLFFAFEGMYIFMGGDAVPQAPLFNLFLQLVSSLVFLFGGIYYAISRTPDSLASRQLAIIGVVGKLLFLFFFTTYALSGDIPFALVALVSVDLFYAMLFIEFIRCQKISGKRLISYTPR
jgi:hypothetical protein